MGDHNGWTKIWLGELTEEAKGRINDATGKGRSVYGVDGHDGLVPQAKYMSSDLTRYKIVEPGMFAYNPMRLNIGSIGYCSDQYEPGLVSPDYVVFKCKENLLLSEFLAWVTRGPEWMAWASQAGVGSVRTRIYYQELSQLVITLPPVWEQKEIALLLKGIAHQIELIEWMNKTLESIACALFQSWFVNFDPVRARMEGRQPFGIAAETATIFPYAFDILPQGQIPAGWKVGSLEDVFDLTMGQSPPGESYNADGIGMPFYQGKTDFGFRFPSVRIHCTTPTRYANKGDTLVSVRAPVGEVNVAIERCTIGRGVAAVSHKSDSPSYTYYSMRAMRAAFMQYEGEGTVFGSINKSDFQGLNVIIPSASVIEAFERLARPLDQLIEANTMRTRSLSTVRDILLPKLLSGEVRVLDAEKIVEGKIAL